MSNAAYALREAYTGTVTIVDDGVEREVPRFLGGLIAIDDTRELDVRAAIDAQPDGIIVVDESDTVLVNRLDGYAPLKRVAAPEDTEPSVGRYDDLNATALRAELRRRDLVTGGPKPELVERLTEHDRVLNAGPDALAGFLDRNSASATPTSGDLGRAGDPDTPTADQEA